MELAAVASSPHQRFDWHFDNLPSGMDVSPEGRSDCVNGVNGGGEGAVGVAGGEEGREDACWERTRSLTWAPAWNQGGLRLVACVTLRVSLRRFMGASRFTFGDSRLVV